MHKSYDFAIGEKYGEFTIIGFSHIKNNKPYVICECSCGTKKVVCYYNLRNGNTKSCGHYRSEYISRKI